MKSKIISGRDRSYKIHWCWKAKCPSGGVVHHDQGSHLKSCPEPETADCTFFTSGKHSSAGYMTFSENFQFHVSFYFILKANGSEKEVFLKFPALSVSVQNILEE